MTSVLTSYEDETEPAVLVFLRRFAMSEKVTRLSALPAKKLRTGHNKLQRFGVTPARWLAMLSSADEVMQQIAAAFPGESEIVLPPGIVYPAKRVGELLGIEVPDVSAPAPVPGRIIIYLPERIKSLPDLRRSNAPMWKDQDWYDQKEYTARPGYWEVLLPVPDSNDLIHSEQTELTGELAPELKRTPVLVDALLLTVHKMATDDDLLKNDWVRCDEQASGGDRVVLTFSGSGLGVRGGDWYDGADGRVWASAARWISS
ncbi:MAG: hypothetical protein A2756_05225 [Candidatus Ryanbacteria bacterium RIFCSPHIGHO2_01_FULL_48_27]|uniref:Uncharacterized protein n=1 Tax=Candidatus Ryanbacteria bacterium RIFCSPHIGHO2_01_FULL_48_27 TaxID=1802115 RepID=A0A1G2FZJ5_9BACT|nr:MAG: hypothetical protein A2756_05225 [Candidatus Ryanbacteria bacterium RIFCSPHIGHO2_01_FULL_48_27]